MHNVPKIIDASHINVPDILVNWASYFAEGHEERKKEWCFKFACWFCDQFWVDMLLDIASLAFFAVATWKSFALFMSGHGVG